jgi:hypothetical protein
MLHQNVLNLAASLNLFWESSQLRFCINISYCASTLGHDSIRGGGAEISGKSSQRM